MKASKLLVCIALLAPLTADAALSASWNLPSNCPTNSVIGSFGAGTIAFATSSGQVNSVQSAAGTWCTDSSDAPFPASSLLASSYFTQFGGDPSSAYGTFAPTNQSLVQLVNPVSGTITFSQAVTNPWIVLTSVGNTTEPNGEGAVTYAFSDAFTVAAYNSSFDNRAYWDNWAAGFEPSFSVTGNALAGREFSGVLQFSGVFTQLSFSTTGSENWHGFTVGAVDFAANEVPEPSSLVLMGAGLLGLSLFARRRKHA